MAMNDMYQIVSRSCLALLAIGAGLVTLLGSAGGPAITAIRYTSDPVVQTVEKKQYKIMLSANCFEFGCNSFDLAIENNTKSDIQLIWDETLFVDNGTTSGGFSLKG